MKVYYLQGYWAIEVIIAESEEKAFEYLMTHDGTGSDGGTLEEMHKAYPHVIVFDPCTMTEAACAGHYSG